VGAFAIWGREVRPDPSVEPSSLFTKLLEMPRPSEVIDFPRKDAQGNPIGQVRVQILTSIEHDRAREAGTSTLKKRGHANEDLTSPAIREVLSDAIAKELIAMACLTDTQQGLDPDGKPLYGRIFRNAKDVDQLGADEILILFNAYMLVQHKYGPFERNLSKEDIDAWIARLQEGAAEFPLLSLALPQLVLLAQSLGERLSTLYRTLASQSESLPSSLVALLPDSFTGTTSAGSPQDEVDRGGSAPSTESAVSITTDQATEMARNFRER
jgi:hypothetical protein